MSLSAYIAEVGQHLHAAIVAAQKFDAVHDSLVDEVARLDSAKKEYDTMSRKVEKLNAEVAMLEARRADAEKALSTLKSKLG